MFVLLPSLAGIAIRAFVGDAAMNRIKPYQNVVNTLVLLLLSYSNALVSLPAAVQQPDPDFLFATLGIVTALCVITFLTGWAIARAVSANQQQEAALMFGLGMNNNGTGLVLASVTLADHPLVMLPIIRCRKHQNGPNHSTRYAIPLLAVMQQGNLTIKEISRSFRGIASPGVKQRKTNQLPPLHVQCEIF
jgi:predicted Na+-dependent transporter